MEKEFEYNTDREELKIPEYGRHIQQMVDYVKTIKDKDLRNKNVRAIIHLMGNRNPHLRDVPDFQHKLWDHLFIMADFDLDADSPFEKPVPEKFMEKPEKLSYPKKGYRFRYYGHIIKEMIDVVVTWPDGELKDLLIQTIANHMKKNYLNWNRDMVDDNVIFEHLAILSDGKISLNTTDNELRESSQLMKKRNGHRNNSKNKYKNYKKKSK